MKEILKENKYLFLGLAAIAAYFIFKPKVALVPVTEAPIVSAKKSCEDAKKLVEDQKAFMASARLTAEAAAAAKAKLAELEAAVTAACSSNMVGNNGFFSSEKEKLNY
jgi:hypothetical protein